MSYTARCTLTVLPNPEDTVGWPDHSMHIVGQIRGRSEEARSAVDEYGRPTGNEGSWRTSEEELRAVTRDVPGLLLQLDKVGDYDGPHHDRYYFLEGRMQHCPGKMTHEPFDETKLR